MHISSIRKAFIKKDIMSFDNRPTIRFYFRYEAASEEANQQRLERELLLLAEVRY